MVQMLDWASRSRAWCFSCYLLTALPSFIEHEIHGERFFPREGARLLLFSIWHLWLGALYCLNLSFPEIPLPSDAAGSCPHPLVYVGNSLSKLICSASECITGKPKNKYCPQFFPIKTYSLCSFPFPAFTSSPSCPSHSWFTKTWIASSFVGKTETIS